MADFVNTIDVLGDKVVADSIIDRSIIECKDNNITKVGDFAFFNCTNLTSVNFPVVTTIAAAAFQNCTNLTSIDFPVVTNLPNNSLISCSKLTALILRSNSLCSLASTYVLKDTPIASGTGYIYVPRALLSDDDATKDYRRATNWSTFTCFRALEDYTVDGTTTGELDATKI
jgi:hypothetical protein